jgi:hypothetical protein
MHTIEVPFTDPSVAPLIRAAFGGVVSRRNVKVRVAETYHVNDYWSGGSRDECRFVKLDTLDVISADQVEAIRNNPYRLPSGEVAVLPGIAVVEHCIFQGKDLGYRVYLHADNMAPLLAKPQAADDLTPEQRRILVNYRSLKSGYRPKYTQEELQPLIDRGYLRQSKNGATGITNEGRAVTANDR